MIDATKPILIVSRRAGGARPLPGYRAVRVDRRTPLGNPFVMRAESDREMVCNQYDSWLKEQMEAGNPGVTQAIEELVDLYLSGAPLALACWCAPKRCHAESIRAAILRVTDLRLASR